jgi:hypothetical protein
MGVNLLLLGDLQRRSEVAASAAAHHFPEKRLRIRQRPPKASSIDDLRGTSIRQSHSRAALSGQYS